MSLIDFLIFWCQILNQNWTTPQVQIKKNYFKKSLSAGENSSGQFCSPIQSKKALRRHFQNDSTVFNFFQPYLVTQLVDYNNLKATKKTRQKKWRQIFWRNQFF